MSPIKKIVVENRPISVSIEAGKEDYICITDITRDKEGEDHIRNWMRNKNTIEFLGTWEHLNNPRFKGVEFDTFLKEAGFNRFNMTPRKWIEATNAIGIVSKAGRNGGTYAHRDIALEFCSWFSPTFKLYLIKEYQRLKEAEGNPLNLEWLVYAEEADVLNVRMSGRSAIEWEALGVDLEIESLKHPERYPLIMKRTSLDCL